MRPFIIGIGGSHSKAGKTTICCRILRRLSTWGAIKYTKTALRGTIVDDPELLGQKNKDTARLLEAGAREVLWVRSPVEGLREILQRAVERLSHLKGIVLEGNSAIEVLRPDIVIFVSGDGEFKKGAERILTLADAVIFEKAPPQGISESVKKFHRDDEEGYIHFITELIYKRKVTS